jgi:hypothetical protein
VEKNFERALNVREENENDNSFRVNLGKGQGEGLVMLVG